VGTWHHGRMVGAYTHGHHESVLRSHTWRTAQNSAGYLLDSLEPGQRLLDVGCGPGTITIDLAARVAPGEVVGIDAEAEVIAQAQDRCRTTDGARPTFATGNVHALDFADGSFDVAHAHQVLQHLNDPVAALREMARVLRPGGVLAVRDSDYAAFAWAPADPRLDRWLELYHQVTARNGAEADAGRHLLGWVQEAGYAEWRATSSTWTFADPDSRAWWGGLWADRVQLSSFAHQAMAYGFTDPDELADMADGWRDWAARPDGFFAVVHGEALARR
jgi:ubiquinone/menaquinone biosynthesis C-methylase UbiE